VEILGRALETGSKKRRQQKQTVTGDLQLGQAAYRVWIPNLALIDTQ